MGNLAKPFTKMSDEELLELLMQGELPPHEKARVVLAVHEYRAAARHNFVLILLTVVVAIATAVQAMGVIRSSAAGESKPYCQCSSRHSEKGATVMRRSDPHSPRSKPARLP